MDAKQYLSTPVVLRETLQSRITQPSDSSQPTSKARKPIGGTLLLATFTQDQTELRSIPG